MDPTPRLSIQDAINACDDRSTRVLDRVFEYQSDRVRRGELDELLLQHWLERGLEHAAHGGLTAVVQRIMVQWLCARHASVTCDDALALAVRSRQLELVQFVLRAERFQHCPISVDDVAAASRAGDVPIVECLVERSGLPVPRDLLQNLFHRPLNVDVLVAALRRHSALWRVDNGICLDGACRWRRLDVLQAIEAIVGSKATFTTRSVLVAAENGDLEMLQWLERRVPWPWDAPVMEVAAGSGNVKLMQWLQTRSSGVEYTSSAMDNAAGGGHLAAVQWLQVNRRGEGCTTDAMDTAAAIGALDVVRWLHEHRTEGCTTSAMDEAAANGHLGVVQFLHAHRSEGCTTSAMDMAAANGHLEVVVWLHNHRREGCTPAAIEGAVTGGFAAVVAWLAQGRVHQDAIAESLKRAEAGGLEDIAYVLRQAMGTEVTDTEHAHRCWHNLCPANGDGVGVHANQVCTVHPQNQRQHAACKPARVADFALSADVASLPAPDVMDDDDAEGHRLACAVVALQDGSEINAYTGSVGDTRPTPGAFGLGGACVCSLTPTTNKHTESEAEDAFEHWFFMHVD
ncbi:hypothetical protein P43SY_005055 [Pythium insidiosum]|uniref:Ankyrin repeat domain containing protein n=1 Tax=Pythium insidiosum TaxID=114742 RepID=A0AAD5LP39_PYTIN|nr:hypothetical protein P43SY_005055 [Pythium insidiosum]